MVENSKQVRVDNWGIFFLQRLQMFFSKTDYCDLTLQFEGNVQLKVHRLVMNACTEYFQILEQNCPTIEENVIMMPSNLQADVIVPIVNFMYTGMLEFHMSIFNKLYSAAEMMNINVLTKLLDAQKLPKPAKRNTWVTQQQEKKFAPPKVSTPIRDLPATLPGRKLPVWKRKIMPMPTSLSSNVVHMESKWSAPPDPLSLTDNAPKPTRFEWPEDDLPTLNLMDTSFDDISYTSKPLLTKEEEIRASTSFDDIRESSFNNRNMHNKKPETSNIDMEDMKDYVKEQRIRSDLATFEDDPDNEIHTSFDSNQSQKRKMDELDKMSPKRIKINDTDSKETTISITSKTNPNDLDHTKLVSEILKKYPHIMKKNKSIRFKIMPSGNKQTAEQPLGKISKLKIQNKPDDRIVVNEANTKTVESKKKSGDEGPWTCLKCANNGEENEYVLYYLYRKHMIDIHNEKFDPSLCKYCGLKFTTDTQMMYHVYTKHDLKPPASYNFPKCYRCPYIAISNTTLAKHRRHHNKNESQCVECGLGFVSAQSLTRHLQITNHTGKNKSNYGCQFCNKKLQSAINLFAHIKSQHLTEAKRDGLVIIEDVSDVEDDANDDETLMEEFIESEMPNTARNDNEKVKIISDLKVPINSEAPLRSGNVLEPSSEAEALSNVASGIATSLGLVDIVVLDDHQQYILQQQENQTDSAPEYILPDLVGNNENPFAHHSHHQVITSEHGNVLPQSMLQSSTGSDIGSTDELVMVLTDHDYQDGQDGAAVDNSNIVVLYSHPVDGQQSQFITSQGNLMVNSQTGMLELRNGATIATSTGEQLLASETPIESIEMIQREIENQGNIKQDTFYAEEEKHQPEPDVVDSLQEADKVGLDEPQESEQQVALNDASNEDLQHNIANEEIDTPASEPIPSENIADNKIESAGETLDVQMDTDNVESKEENPVTNPVEEKVTETAPISESPKQPEIVEEQTPELPLPETPKEEQEVLQDISEEKELEPVESNIDKDSTENQESVMDVDEGKIENVPEENTVQATGVEPTESVEEKTAEEEVLPNYVETADQEHQEAPELREHEEISQSASESQQESCPQSETSNSQFNDENSQSSQDETQTTVAEIPNEKETNSQNASKTSSKPTKISILDDWDDTDSQQSEKQQVCSAMKEAAEERVNKLMDDWEEEEEDEGRRDTSN